MQILALHSRRACFGAAGNPDGEHEGCKPSYKMPHFLGFNQECGKYMGGLRPPYPPSGFPARFAGGNGANNFALFRHSLGKL